MSSFTISPRLNKNKIFILKRSELEKRIDPFYYVPSLVELEKKVLAKKPKRLRDYVKEIASGATPKTTESELYYTNKGNGIPFLRVQNLSPTGVLEFDDCKYINIETHNRMLKRSQVSAGDLLVKITGVGRMAVASVAPENFAGNINQHICVIKTGSREMSETLASFLNSDIGEKLASRRSTGGTRPALDYPALLSIPILIDKRVVEISKQVVEQKKQNEAAAEKLLAGIDDYLLKELGITLPVAPENILKNRIFQTSISAIVGKRFDPYYYSGYLKAIENSIRCGAFPTDKILSVVINIDTGRTPARNMYVDEETENKLPIVKAGSYTNDFIDFSKCDYTFLGFNGNQVYEGDIFILGAAHQAEYVGKKVYYLDETPSVTTFFVGELVRISVDKSKYESSFLFSILKTDVYSVLLNREKRGQTSHLYPDDVKRIEIPIPPLDKQKEIASHITDIRKQAQALKDKTKEALEKAGKEIEEILLN